MKNILLFLLGVFLSVMSASSACEASVKDSIGVVTRDNRKFILHKIVPNESLGVIARHYRTSLAEVLRHNPQIDKETCKIRPGQVLYIPIVAPSAIPASSATGRSRKTYTVRSGENLYHIARRFDVSIAEIKKLNNLKAEELYEGQKLVIEIDQQVQGFENLPDMVFRPAEPAASSRETTATNGRYKYHTVKDGESLYKIAATYNVKVDSLKKWNNLKQTNFIDVDQQLIVSNLAPSVNLPSAPAATARKAKSIHDTGMGAKVAHSKGHSALHRTAPLHSIIIVTNESTRKSVQVKVVGKITDIAANKKVIIQLSADACEALGVVGEQFPVTIIYAQEED